MWINYLLHSHIEANSASNKKRDVLRSLLKLSIKNIFCNTAQWNSMYTHKLS